MKITCLKLVYALQRKAKATSALDLYFYDQHHLKQKLNYLKVIYLAAAE